MLATSRTKALAQVLDGLQTSVEQAKRPLQVRVQTKGGATIGGQLNAASLQHVSVIEPGLGERREIAAQDIAAIYVAVPHRGREWLLAGTGIALGTAAMVGISLLPGVDLSHNAQGAFAVVFVAGVGALNLLFRTRLRSWLARWEPWYDGGSD